MPVSRLHQSILTALALAVLGSASDAKQVQSNVSANKAPVVAPTHSPKPASPKQEAVYKTIIHSHSSVIEHESDSISEPDPNFLAPQGALYTSSDECA